jgi:hypothetical protein
MLYTCSKLVGVPVALYLPELQGKHVVAPKAVEKNPDSHDVHVSVDAAPSALEYVSAKHCRQALSLVAPEVVENVPAPQLRQTEEFK